MNTENLEIDMHLLRAHTGKISTDKRAKKQSKPWTTGLGEMKVVGDLDSDHFSEIVGSKPCLKCTQTRMRSEKVKTERDAC